MLAVVFAFACEPEDDTPASEEELQAAFTANDTVIIAGDEVQFVDQSTGTDSTTQWNWIFKGGTPGSSSEKKPATVTYEEPGVYEVSLTITDGTVNSTETKTDYITVQVDSSVFCAENPFACADSVATDENKFSDNITQTNQRNVYKVVVPESGVIEVTIEDIPGNLSLFSELFASDNTSQSLKTEFFNNGRLYYELLVRPGTYYVTVKDRNNSVSEENYNITINLDRTDENEWNGSTNNATPLTLGETITGTLRTDEDEDFFAVSVNQYGVLKIQVSGVSEVRTTIALLNENGEELSIEKSSRNEGGSVSALYLVPDLETYYIKLSGDASSNEKYNLTVSLDSRDAYEYNNSRSDAKEINQNEDVKGTLLTQDDEDWFSMTFTEPGTLIAKVTDVDDSIDLEMDLYLPGNNNPVRGNEVVLSSRLGGPRSLYYIVDSGTYLLKLRARTSSSSGYDLYNLNITLNTDDPNEINNERNLANTININEDIKGTFGTYQDEDWFEVTLQPGDARLTVTGVDNNLDMQAFLYAETGNALSEKGKFGSGNSITRGEPIDITYSIEKAGTYYIKLEERVNSGLDNNDLDQSIYTLRVTQ